jgi:hypothetical protein
MFVLECYGQWDGDSQSCVTSWNFTSKKLLPDFLWCPHALASSHAPAFMSLTCMCETCLTRGMLRMSLITPRTRCACTRRAYSNDVVFFFFVWRTLIRVHHTDRVINAPCVAPLRGFSPPVQGSIFWSFLGSSLVPFFCRFFRHFFVLWHFCSSSISSSTHH